MFFQFKPFTIDNLRWSKNTYAESSVIDKSINKRKYGETSVNLQGK